MLRKRKREKKGNSEKEKKITWIDLDKDDERETKIGWNNFQLLGKKWNWDQIKIMKRQNKELIIRKKTKMEKWRKYELSNLLSEKKNK